MKRQREKARQEKQAAKREKRHDRSKEDTPQPEVDEDDLMEEFARLSQLFDNDRISQAQFETERHRIFVELGIESASE